MKTRLLGAVCAVVFGFITVPSQAALTSVLGGQAYYDDVADLTWLADASYAQTSGYDTDGYMNWAGANAWAAGLDINGVTGWRLPDTLQPDASCDSQTDPGGGFDLQGYGYNCTGGELGNLFYNVLGGVASNSITTTHNTNYDLFSNVLSDFYWSGTEYAPFTYTAWYFKFSNGYQDSNASKTYFNFAWAVHSGGSELVSSVPIPAALYLFTSGLLGLIGIPKKRKA